MKKLIPFIIPVLIFSFLYSTTVKAQTATTGRVTVSYSSDLKTWDKVVDITDHVQGALDRGETFLSLEITIGVEDQNTMVVRGDDPTVFGIQSFDVEIKDDIGFFRAASTLSEVVSAPSLNKAIGPPQCAAAGIIIAIMVLIVLGIIIYLLIRTCQRLLP